MTSLTVGDSRSRTVTFSRQDIARYAGASGDFNRIHVDEPFATDAGYPAVVVMGMLPAGWVGTVVQDWVGRRTIETFGVEFRDIVHPGDELTIGLTVTEIADETATIDVNVTNEADVTVLTGTVEAAIEEEDAGTPTDTD